MITEENGFKNVVTLKVGESPFDEIDRRDKEYEKKSWYYILSKKKNSISSVG